MIEKVRSLLHKKLLVFFFLFIIVENIMKEPSSNSGRGNLHFYLALITLSKGVVHIFSKQLWVNFWLGFF